MHCHNNSPFVIHSLVLKQTIIINIIIIIACVAGGLARRRKIRWGKLDFWRHVEQIQKEEKNWREGGGGGDEKDRLPEN